ncbi:MAG TPA: DSD1 family PLP-dependent enzyme [Dehalococcoidia bacterium]|nr:DSD1 family PLP-dependent enzyme [Dehalococcoidia bacterium]
MTSPRTIHDIPTPALILDVPAMQKNIWRMAEFFAEGPCKLRPHFKAHKTPEIARRQLAAGSCVGLTCATVGEAEVASGFCDDILIANQVIGLDKCARVAILAKSGVDIKVAVDSELGLEQMSKAALDTETTVGVLIEVNIGFRAGTPPGEPALALARRGADTPGVQLRGLMGYEGPAAGIEERDRRDAMARGALDRLLSTVPLFKDAGLPTDIVSAGSTGTYDMTGRMDGVTEIQAGSYVLMDTAYGKEGLPFEQAFWVLGTVLSRPSPTSVTADCGHKSCSQDHGMPDIRDVPGATVMFLADEHAMITVPPESMLKPGVRVQLVPSHIDPTINLHDVFYALEDDTVVGTWPIEARGYSEQRMEL